MEMNYSLGDYIGVVGERLAPAIIGAVELARIRQLADQLPGELSTFFGFECPMTVGRRDADFLFCSTQTDKQSRILAGHHNTLSLPDTGQCPAWRKVVEFCSEWEREHSVCHNALQNIWLEFDIGQSPPPWAPSMFFGLDPDDYSNPRAMSDKVLDVLPLLDRAAVEGERLRTLERVMQAIPTNAHIFQVGVMLSRNAPAIRVCIRNIQAERVAEFLHTIGWQAGLSSLQSQLDAMAGKFETVDVDLDIGASIGDKVGLEFAFGNQSSTLSMMRDFLEQCVASGYIDQQKADGLVEYNGLVHDDSEPGKWPAYLRKQSALIGADVINFVACWIHHIKLDFTSGDQVSAKAYLALQPGRASRADLLQSVQSSKIKE